MHVAGEETSSNAVKLSTDLSQLSVGSSLYPTVWSLLYMAVIFVMMSYYRLSNFPVNQLVVTFDRRSTSEKKLQCRSQSWCYFCDSQEIGICLGGSVVSMVYMTFWPDVTCSDWSAQNAGRAWITFRTLSSWLTALNFIGGGAVAYESGERSPSVGSSGEVPGGGLWDELPRSWSSVHTAFTDFYRATLC